ncbi:MSMEG_6728 family protein [Streptomyces sp. 549]|uniref:MSMEG_6728 family protein n=1 Tax=Streptomyces sp. 549 TaxID=3049076 RepID=UPI0024C36076|nr:MSMEG_6728 family protein [Streptomyces sp. 549]MDK1474682.1 MSMEG_6728 family protein [Streptomyces sp. 549]
MQTFLPYADFTESARALDPRRLGKQRVEALQVLRGLTVPGYGWRHHPAVKMWIGYREALVRYGLAVCAVWTEAGRADTCAALLVGDLAEAGHRGHVRDGTELAEAGELPPWLGDEEFHRSHRSALVGKDPAYYRPLFPDVPAGLPYVWPTSDRTGLPPGPALP